MKPLQDGLVPSTMLSNLQTVAQSFGDMENQPHLYALIDAATLDEPVKKIKTVIK